MASMRIASIGPILKIMLNIRRRFFCLLMSAGAKIHKNKSKMITAPNAKISDTRDNYFVESLYL